MYIKIFLVISVSLFFAVGACAQGGMTSTAAAASTAADKPAKPPRFTPTKDQIMQGQKTLKEKKLYDGETTGVYNDPTRVSIKSFQKSNGLTETGKFDKATLEKMNIALTDKQKGIAPTASTTSSKTTKTTGDAPKKPAPFRANADQVKAAQKLLKSGKMYSGEETGKLDDATREGLKKYQDANKVKVTGTLNAVTLEKMGIALTDAQKANVAASAATTPK